jgi:hypothetical protein
MGELLHLLWAVVVVGSVSFTIGHVARRLDRWLDDRNHRHAHPKRRWE